MVQRKERSVSRGFSAQSRVHGHHEPNPAAKPLRLSLPRARCGHSPRGPGRPAPVVPGQQQRDADVSGGSALLQSRRPARRDQCGQAYPCARKHDGTD